MATSKQNFEDFLKSYDGKFTVILGSGFHRQAIGYNSILSNWGKLLKDMDPDLKLTGFYPLDYEQLIIRRTKIEEDVKLKGKPANIIEQKLSDEICYNLNSAQEKALKSNKHCYPISLFNPEKISDIISLNFDTTAEKICCSIAKTKTSISNHVVFKSDINDDLIVPYWEVKFNNNEIRFWYPHGSIHDKDKVALGTREYSKRLNSIERLRNHSKSTKKSDPISWYHQLTQNPVLILGAHMGKDEWDIWFAIVNRERNFAKSENLIYKKPIFQMRECECKQDYKHEWFEPLYKGLSYKEQWEKLDKLF